MNASTKRWHRVWTLLCLLSACVSGPVLAQNQLPAGPVPLRIAAGPASERMFTAASVIANIVSNPPGGPACPDNAVCGPTGLVGEARSTLSTSANIDSLANGESETAFVEGDALWQAYNGFGRFAGRPLGDLRALAVLYTESVFIVVRARTPIGSISQLRGKTVALGRLDDPHAQTLAAILAEHGVRSRDLTFIHLGLENAAAALDHGDVDAAIVVAAALPDPFREVAEHTPLRLLPIDAAIVQRLARQQPYLIPVEIGDLAEGRRRTNGVAFPVLWVSTQHLPARIAYGLVRSLQAPVNREAIAQALPRSSAVAEESALTRSPIPLHIGAASWFEETSGAVR